MDPAHGAGIGFGKLSPATLVTSTVIFNVRASCEVFTSPAASASVRIMAEPLDYVPATRVRRVFHRVIETDFLISSADPGRICGQIYQAPSPARRTGCRCTSRDARVCSGQRLRLRLSRIQRWLARIRDGGAGGLRS
jgi:hypothetical protein